MYTELYNRNYCICSCLWEVFRSKGLWNVFFVFFFSAQEYHCDSVLGKSVCVCVFFAGLETIRERCFIESHTFCSTQLSRTKASSANLYYLIRLFLFFQFEGATRLFAVGRRILEPIEIMDLFLVSVTVFHCCCSVPTPTVHTLVSLYFCTVAPKPFWYWLSTKCYQMLITSSVIAMETSREVKHTLCSIFKANNIAKSYCNVFLRSVRLTKRTFKHSLN